MKIHGEYFHFWNGFAILKDRSGQAVHLAYGMLGRKRLTFELCSIISNEFIIYFYQIRIKHIKLDY
jgi:hypothetical protein